ncbi:hypothetical protein D3C71_2056470 [compost metagenome]
MHSIKGYRTGKHHPDNSRLPAVCQERYMSIQSCKFQQTPIKFGPTEQITVSVIKHRLARNCGMNTVFAYSKIV